MANGLPPKAKVGTIDLPTYFLALRMEKAGKLVRGQALMLAASLAKPVPKPQKGKRK